MHFHKAKVAGLVVGATCPGRETTRDVPRSLCQFSRESQRVLKIQVLAALRCSVT